MKDELISFETAKLAKEKGFGKTLETIYPHSYLEDGKIVLNSCNNTEEGLFSAPTQSLLQKWLRDIHNIHINVSNLHLSKGEWREQAYNLDEGHYKGAPAGFHFKTYEKALEIGLQEALKLIKND